jgi:hypothetical protein
MFCIATYIHPNTYLHTNLKQSDLDKAALNNFQQTIALVPIPRSNAVRGGWYRRAERRLVLRSGRQKQRRGVLLQSSGNVLVVLCEISSQGPAGLNSLCQELDAIHCTLHIPNMISSCSSASIVWDIMPRSPMLVNGRPAYYLLHAGFLFGLLFSPED